MGAVALCGSEALMAGAQPALLRKRQQSTGCMHDGTASPPPVQHLPCHRAHAAGLSQHIWGLPCVRGALHAVWREVLKAAVA